MKPKTRQEGYWRMFGYEERHIYQHGTGAGRAARRITRKMSNRAMRQHAKDQIREGLEDAEV